MFWLDYTIESGVDKFRVKGDWDMELVEKGLYKPGDVFIVDENGWLVKSDEVNALLIKHESNKLKQSQQHDPKP
jgi:hypothetical protein